MGVDTTRKIIDNLTAHASRKELKDAEALYSKLREEMSDILAGVDKPLVIEDKKPYVILMVGVNGVGKTTTIGKLARQYQSEGKTVMLAAGDTFRAAAVEQLQVWGNVTVSLLLRNILAPILHQSFLMQSNQLKLKAWMF